MQYIPEQAKLVKEAAKILGYEYADIDEGNGYLIKVKNGEQQIFLSSGLVCRYPINSATSVGLASDKAHTARILTSVGCPCIPGNHFFVTESHIKLRNPGHEYADAIAYAEGLGYPVFCKPNRGSSGDFAERIDSTLSLKKYIDRVKAKYETVIIQHFVIGKEYRIFCFEKEVMFGYKKSPDVFVGDGILTIGEQVNQYNEMMKGTGISPIDRSNLMARLKTEGKDLSSIMAQGEILNVQHRANITAGGVVDDFSIHPPQALSDLALQCASTMNLRVCGVDIIDISQKGDLSNLMVIEVNGNPSLSSLIDTERMSIAIDIWMRLLKGLL